MTGDVKLKEVGAGGEITHGSLGQASFPFSVKTYARMLGLTRQDIINDDLGALDEIPRMIGRGAAETLEELFWQLVLANTGDYFGAGNGNYIDGTTSALGLTGLGLAVTKMRKLVDANGAPVVVSPKYLAVPPELETTADTLYTSTNVVMAGDTDAVQPDGNPYKGKYQPLVVPHLSNSTYSGYSLTGWYLFGPADDAAAFGIAYLNGVESPIIETADTDFNTLGIQFRGYADFGVCQSDSKGAVMAKGTT